MPSAALSRQLHLPCLARFQRCGPWTRGFFSVLYLCAGQLNDFAISQEMGRAASGSPPCHRETLPTDFKAANDDAWNKLSEKSKRMLLPHYTDCIRKPTFKTPEQAVTCDILRKPESKWTRDHFKTLSSVIMDLSGCQVFVKDFRPPSQARAELQPFEVELRPKSRDHDVLRQLYCGGDFGFMHRLTEYLPLRRPTTILDAGANIGLSSILFSHMIMSYGEVLAVEANPETLQVRLAPPAHTHAAKQLSIAPHALPEARHHPCKHLTATPGVSLHRA